MLRISTNSAEETAEAGERLGRTLRAGDVVCLSGGLGAGKTAFAGGLAKALGISGYITSPTFSIVNEYSGSLALYHFDVYRIADADEMYEIGFEEYLDAGGVVAIEWAENIEGIIPEKHIRVRIDKVNNAAADEAGFDKRVVTFEFSGEGSERSQELLMTEMLGMPDLESYSD
ncbi:MAG: tRNA (adenosine(37)-N6)-threonylcarbamoyltransferase complex ATPase subunit type 1 TsaE [Clostridiales bacterium]|nr:tRNA (adenosine(37)-N6)-threonylcarbamoyltransferase complex ATPase subunit type 1 TsaE [Clostridiales bacterium]